MNICVQIVATFMALCIIVCVPLRDDEETISPQPNKSAAEEHHWQLFLDDQSITRSTGFKRVLHHPQPRGVVMRPEKPWETFGITPWYVGQRKDGLFECYYQSLWWNQNGQEDKRIASAINPARTAFIGSGPC